MPKVIFLPHAKLCQNGVTLKAKVGETILDVALRNGIEIEHACEKLCICATCHCFIRKGFSSLTKITEKEYDSLDKAWGLESESRLSCQARINNEDIIVEIPLYSTNHI